MTDRAVRGVLRTSVAAVRESLYGWVARAAYGWRRRLHARRLPRVLSVEATIDRVIADRCSVARFGDGEAALMTGRDIDAQRHEPALAAALRQVMVAAEPGLLVCVPDIFDGMAGAEATSRRFWTNHLFRRLPFWLSMTQRGRVYGNAFLSRPYLFYGGLPPERVARRFAHAKELWRDRDVLMIEGEMTRFGVGNDLLDGARDVRRIVCPPRDAFGAIDAILDACPPANATGLCLVALGAAAKPLVLALHRRGWQAIDIGHLDVEYEWYRRGAVTPTAIPGKLVAEAGGTGSGAINLAAYIQQIARVIR